MSDKKGGIAQSVGYFFKAMFNPDQWSDVPTEAGDTYRNGYVPYGSYSWLGSYLRIYRGSNNVRAVTSYLANNFASTPHKTYRRLDDDIREALYDHGLALTMRQPNPETTQHVFLRDLFMDLALFDVTMWKKVRVGDKLLLMRMFPDGVRLEGGTLLAPESFWEVQTDGSEKEYKRRDVFWLHGYGGRRGVSPMETLRRELQMDEDEVQARQQQARSGWRNVGVITRPSEAPEWGEVGRARFLEQVEARYSGTGDMAGKPLLLEEDMAWHPDANPAGNQEYVAARTLTLKQVCLAYHLAPQMLGAEGAPYSSIIEYKNQLFQITLGPKFDYVEQEIDLQLLPEFEDTKDVYGEFDINAMLRGDPAAQASIAANAVGAPYVTRNEWRAKVWNLPPIEGGEKLYDPSGAGSGAAGQGAPMSDPYASLFEPGAGIGSLSDDDFDFKAWDGNGAMSKCVLADNPSQAFASVCAGKVEGEDPNTRSAWRLPHHDSPGGPANLQGVQMALGRVDQAPISNTAAARAHLEAHLRDLKPEKAEEFKHQGGGLGAHFHPHPGSEAGGEKPAARNDAGDKWLLQPAEVMAMWDIVRDGGEMTIKQFRQELASMRAKLRQSGKFELSPKMREAMEASTTPKEIDGWEKNMQRMTERRFVARELNLVTEDKITELWGNAAQVGVVQSAPLKTKPKKGLTFDDLGTKAEQPIEISPELIETKRDVHVEQLHNKLTALFSEWEDDALTGSDGKSWVQELSGALHMTAMAVTGDIGELVANSDENLKYDSSRTVNYWTKVTREQAKSLVAGIKADLADKPAEVVFGRLKGQVGAIAQTLGTRASGWAIMEVGRQSGLDENMGS